MLPQNIRIHIVIYNISQNVKIMQDTLVNSIIKSSVNELSVSITKND